MIRLGLILALAFCIPTCDSSEGKEGRSAAFSGGKDKSGEALQREYFPVGGTLDFSYDGEPDCTLVDADGDGLSDGLDFDADGLPNALLLDTDGDGVSDAVDADGNGSADAFLIGPSAGNLFGLSTTVYSGDPVILIDANDDGYIDGLDVDFDFVADFDLSANL